MAKDSINIAIGAKDNASQVIQKVGASTIALGVALYDVTKNALVGMINGLRGWVDEAMKAEKANVMLDAALRGMGTYTPEVSKRMSDLADAIQNETGTSDEAVKANLALLTSLGVMPDKIDVAARGMSALEALNIDGSMAAKAMARALEGDFEAFNRIAPSVRAATTEQEKSAAVMALINAGYSQQQANLQTVGGAWDALTGRIGDAKEAIMLSIFEGLKLGSTFDSMQASMGAFLKSESFQGFLKSLKDGAAYALDIGKALTTQGGFAEIGGLIGDVILEALKEGANYVGEKISQALGVTSAKSGMSGLGKLFAASGAMSEGGIEGAASGGLQGNEITREILKPEEQQARTGFRDALARLNAAIVKRAVVAEKAADTADKDQREVDRVEEDRKNREALKKQLDEAALKATQKKAAIEKQKLESQQAIDNLENRIKEARQAEADASEKLAKAKEAQLAAAKQNIGEFIKSAKEQAKEDKDRDDAERKQIKKLNQLAAFERRFGEKRMSQQNRDALRLAREKVNEDVRKAKELKEAEADAKFRKWKTEEAEKELKEQRRKNADNLQRIADSVDGALKDNA